MDDKTITITETQYKEAVKKACCKFAEIGAEKSEKDPMYEMISMLQNTMFGAILGDILFENKGE